MKKTIPHFVGALALSLITGVASAQAALAPDHFDHLDTDKSGGISEAEYMRFMEDAFKKLDTDGSGTLTPEEVQQLLTPAQFAEADRNDDGELTLDELIEQVMKEFRLQDADKDGELRR